MMDSPEFSQMYPGAAFGAFSFGPCGALGLSPSVPTACQAAEKLSLATEGDHRG
jgi:hypothetical protein